MCFSASASFGVGVVLTVIGTASVKLVKTPAELPFAVIPLLFAAQQFNEGFLWLFLSDTGNPALQTGATCIFLFIAQVLWPFWVPFAIYKIEPESNRKKFLGFVTGIGIIVSLYLLYCLLNYDVESTIAGRHIAYEQNYPHSLAKYGGVLYVIATIGSPFLSSLKRMGYLGLSILVSYIISAIFYTEYLVSVWCFFASIISILVYVVLHAIRASPDTGVTRILHSGGKQSYSRE